MNIIRILPLCFLTSFAMAAEEERTVCESGEVWHAIQVVYPQGWSLPCEVHFTTPEEKRVVWNAKTAEGFCNLGSYLIYKNDATHFSQIHLQAMENDPDEIYGSGFRYMKSILLEIGWEKLLTKMRTF